MVQYKPSVAYVIVGTCVQYVTVWRGTGGIPPTTCLYCITTNNYLIEITDIRVLNLLGNGRTTELIMMLEVSATSRMALPLGIDK